MTARRDRKGAIPRTKRSIAAALALVLLAPAARAHHPGDRLDDAMGDKERYFQKIDRPAPAFDLVDADGNRARLSDHADKVVVLHFVYASCPDVCPLHAEKIADVQRAIGITPMKDAVRFVTVTTDPANDTPAVLKSYGAAHGLDAGNWTFLTTGPGQSEDATRKLAEAFGHKFAKADDGYQMHGVVTHVIDRNGRGAANFHGLRFATVNMVLYINGLVNRHQLPAPADGWWRRLKRLFD